MRTELAPLIVVKQEFPDFRIDGRLASLSENGEENNNIFANIKSENDCNNNQSEDLNSPLFRVKKSKKKIFLSLSTNPWVCGGRCFLSFGIWCD